MKWLARLKKQKIPASQPTEPTEPGFVGFVGAVDEPILKFTDVVAPANDDRPVLAPAGAFAAVALDRWAWPNSLAMNGVEINTFSARLVRFTDQGLTSGRAEALADLLVARDRDTDDRGLCLECQHLVPGPDSYCSRWAQAGLGSATLPQSFTTMLQRCQAFKGHDHDESRTK